MTRFETSHTDDAHVVLGKLTSPHGIKGWLKVYSYTNPIDSIMEYPEWWVRQGESLTRMTVIQGRRQGKGLVVQLKGVDDRTAAEALAQTDILMPKEVLPTLSDDEYYWHELEGLTVFTQSGERLGQVSYLFETGANDVIVVRGDNDAIDKRERLLPFLPDDVIVEISLEDGRMVVNWDPEF
ncbi:ribosome maturation factor RimM [Vreelandella alkaliphila]|uniref:ribosome maturation factor RimM n=1 Tax=Halomonadaceae TaxID=28256 RepID=UPI001E4319C4|nr:MULTISPECIES: ribosome maturation factor RimM [unclassified Halomonas]MCD6005953.1 ribosome maturation factor RimM [Halomonas sp. IOP_6]MCD6439444.1 ribosome maturation factor RimM [Halomonas sp.]